MKRQGVPRVIRAGFVLVVSVALFGALFSPPVLAESADNLQSRTAISEDATPIDNLLVIHDSVILGARKQIEAAFPASAVDYVGFGGMRVGPAADILSSRADLIGDKVVVELGTNYLGSRSLFRSELDRLMGLLVDVDHVLWLTASRYRPEMDEVNAEIRAAARRYRNLQIGEWGPLSDANSSYTWNDGIHLPPTGAEAIAEMIRSHLEGDVAWNQIPVGRIGKLRDGRKHLTIGGWAADPDLGRSPKVRVVVNGEVVKKKRTSQTRSDIAVLTNSVVDDLGFTIRLDLPDGEHRICIEVNNFDGFEPLSVDCRTVTLAHSPVGQLERVVAKDDGDVVRGWAADPDRARPVVVEVRAGGTDGEVIARGRANRERVAAAAGGADRGFAIKIPANVDDYCVVARNVLAGVDDTVLGCR